MQYVIPECMPPTLWSIIYHNNHFNLAKLSAKIKWAFLRHSVFFALTSTSSKVASHWPVTADTSTYYDVWFILMQDFQNTVLLLQTLSYQMLKEYKLSFKYCFYYGSSESHCFIFIFLKSLILQCTWTIFTRRTQNNADVSTDTV